MSQQEFLPPEQEEAFHQANAQYERPQPINQRHKKMPQPKSDHPSLFHDGQQPSYSYQAQDIPVTSQIPSSPPQPQQQPVPTSSNVRVRIVPRNNLGAFSYIPLPLLLLFAIFFLVTGQYLLLGACIIITLALLPVLYTIKLSVGALQSIAFQVSNKTLPQGGQFRYEIFAVYDDGERKLLPPGSVLLESEDPLVAMINEQGIVTAIGEGQTVVHAAYHNLSTKTILAVMSAEPLPAEWEHLDIGNMAIPGDVAFNGNTFYVSGSGADVWETKDEGHFLYQQLPGDGSLIVRLTTIQHVHQYAKAGLMIRNGLFSGADLIYLRTHPDGNIQVIAGNASSTGIHPAEENYSYHAFPRWLKLDRTGNVVTASVSDNGQNWQQRVELAFPLDIAYLGMFVTARGADILNTSEFDNVHIAKDQSSIPSIVSELPLPWQRVDIGDVATMGNTGYHDGTFTLQATGADIYDHTDEGFFVYQQLPGDGTITIRVVSEGDAHPYAKAGLMVRNSLQTGAHLAILALTPIGSLQFASGSARGTGIHTTWEQGWTKAPFWLRLQRSGEKVTAYTSSDGNQWQHQSETSLPVGMAYIGLVKTSHHRQRFNSATFDHVVVETTEES